MLTTEFTEVRGVKTVEELVSGIASEADELISERLADMITPSAEEKIPA